MKTLVSAAHTRLNPYHRVQRNVELWGADTALCSCGKRWDFTLAPFRARG